MRIKLSLFLSTLLALLSCVQQKATTVSADTAKNNPFSKSISKPLVPGIFTADPSAHVFNGKIYIYPSHDIDAGIAENDLGDHFAMTDYHVYSMEDPGSKVKDHGVALKVSDIPWGGRQLWAPDVAYKNGNYYLYFPLKDKQDIFRIGVAVSPKPEGPFKPQSEAIKGSFSIDPAVFTDTDSSPICILGEYGAASYNSGKMAASTLKDLKQTDLKMNNLLWHQRLQSFIQTCWNSKNNLKMLLF